MLIYWKGPSVIARASAESRFLFAGAACVPWRNSPELRRYPEPRTRAIGKLFLAFAIDPTRSRTRRDTPRHSGMICVIPFSENKPTTHRKRHADHREVQKRRKKQLGERRTSVAPRKSRIPAQRDNYLKEQKPDCGRTTTPTTPTNQIATNNFAIPSRLSPTKKRNTPRSDWYRGVL
jgi:hypothetical protein